MTNAPKRKGRPPSAAARQQALQAAHDILMEQGFGRLTIEAVSARSKVSKPTIYRNWANAQELAMAALLARALPETVAVGTTAEVILLAQMRALITAFASTRGRQVTMTLAAADPQSEFTKAFRNQVILSSREAGRKTILGGLERGEIAQPLDFDVLLDMIFGPVFYRLLVGHGPLDQAFGAAIVKTAFRSLKN